MSAVRSVIGSPSYLAIDLGASSGRAMLGTLDGACMTMREVHRFRTPLIDDGTHLSWDIEALWSSVTTALALALRADARLRSVSIDSWAVDYVPLDAAGAAVRAPYSYRDGRTKGRMRAAAHELGAARLYDRTGIQFLDINTLPQVMADLEDEPLLVRRTGCRLSIADYFLYRLSGRRVAERSMASTTQLLDVRTRDWDTDLITALGDEPARWPEVVSSGTVLGEVISDVLPASSPGRPMVIASCSHDTADAVAAIPADPSQAWSFISSGTWSLIGAEVSQPVLSEAARVRGFTNEAGFPDTVRFLKNRTGMWVVEECVREWSAAGDAASYDALFLEAASARSSGGVLDLDEPQFGERGSMSHKLEAACSKAGIPAPRTRASIVRLVLESLAATYRTTLDELDALLERRTEVLHIVGGGAKNRLLNQLAADACDVRVIAGPEEATALGNLLIQAYALGELPPGLSVRDAARVSTTIDAYTPREGCANRRFSSPNPDRHE